MWGGLVDMYEAGAVRAVGVSNYGPKQLKRIHKCVQDAVGTATGSMRDFASGQVRRLEAWWEICQALGR